MSKHQNNNNSIIELSSSREFVDFIDTDFAKDRLIIIDFYTSWCGPCKKLGEFILNLLDNNEKYNKAIFIKINIEKPECVQLIEKFEISSIPRIIIMKNKKIISDIEGFNPQELVKQLDNYLSD